MSNFNLNIVKNVQKVQIRKDSDQSYGYPESKIAFNGNQIVQINPEIIFPSYSRKSGIQSEKIAQISQLSSKTNKLALKINNELKQFDSKINNNTLSIFQKSNNQSNAGQINQQQQQSQSQIFNHVEIKQVQQQSKLSQQIKNSSSIQDQQQTQDFQSQNCLEQIREQQTYISNNNIQLSTKDSLSPLPNSIQKNQKNILNFIENKYCLSQSSSNNLNQQQQSHVTFITSDHENALPSVWDLEEGEVYVDTLETKPKMHVQLITPETQADENEFYDDFDFQLDEQNDYSERKNEIFDDIDEDYYEDFDF